MQFSGYFRLCAMFFYILILIYSNLYVVFLLFSSIHNFPELNSTYFLLSSINNMQIALFHQDFLPKIYIFILKKSFQYVVDTFYAKLNFYRFALKSINIYIVKSFLIHLRILFSNFIRKFKVLIIFSIGPIASPFKSFFSEELIA